MLCRDAAAEPKPQTSTINSLWNTDQEHRQNDERRSILTEISYACNECGGRLTPSNLNPLEPNKEPDKEG